MKIFLSLISLIYLLVFNPSNQYDDYYYYTVDETFEYLDTEGFEDIENQCIIGNLSKIFSDSYAFNEISKNPPQPSFKKNYHTTVNIQERFKNINTKDSNIFNFYRNITYALSDLKDSHIRIFFKNNDIEEFNILSPFYFYIGKTEKGDIRMYADCQFNEEMYNNFEVEDKDFDLALFCLYHNKAPVKSINNKDPFEYISNFGGNFVSTKNVHGSFTFKMSYHNDVPLSDFPLTQEELNYLEVAFDDEDKTIIKTKFIIKTLLNLEEEQQNNLRSLSNGRKFLSNYEMSNKKKLNKKEKLKNINKNKRNKKLRNLSLKEIYWNYKLDEDFKCYKDDQNRINVYYVASFDNPNRQEYINVMKKCVELFDNNTYPILVVNQLNNGGYFSLSQIFLGILSPLMPINLYKGRIKTSSLKSSDEVLNYINTNLVNVHNCQKATYDYLIKDQVSVNYSDSNLSQIFYITNSTIHNEIESIRKTMKNKRKPTDILVLTDGYSFSSAGIYIKYLQKMGGAIVAGYFGNPLSKEVFDSSQSPSSVFTSTLLNHFSKKETDFLKNNFNIFLEMPVIQTFYDLKDKEVPLEYEVTPVDLRFDIYEEINGDNYETFVNQSLKIFNNTKCYKNNVIKFSEECDKHFKNNYTHGGYVCNQNGTWSNVCVEAYCDLGYIFDKERKKCIKDVCSSIPVPDEKEEEEKEKEKEEGQKQEEESKNNTESDDSNGSTIALYIVTICIVVMVVIFIVVFVIIHCNKKRINSSDVDYNK